MFDPIQHFGYEGRPSRPLVMQKKSTCRSGFLSLRTLVALLFCAVITCFIVIPTRSGLAFLRPENPSNVSQGTLSFEQRVSYQRAIEDVYWRHRIWPKENRGPKPSLDAVMSQAQLEKKVADYLRNSQELEDYWQRPITAEQLQAEMDRMAKHTRQAEVLQELFEALGNDPFVIAECLARPALTDRLLTSWYTYDQRIHGKLKQRAEAELQLHPAVEHMKQLSGKYSEIELVRTDATQRKNTRVAQHGGQLNPHEWDEAVQKLAGVLGVQRHVAALKSADISAHSKRPADKPSGTIPTGKLSPLQEDESRYYFAAVIEKTKDRLKLATVSWLKEPLETWLRAAENQLPTAITVPSISYKLPTISGGGCSDDTWTATAGPPDGRQHHTAVWTGSEMIVWGGEVYTHFTFGSGGRYNTSTDTWTTNSAVNAPASRAYHTAVWTGTEMIVWGGGFSDLFNSGGRYDPGTDSWTATSTTNAPSGRFSHTAVWIGSEMIIWGGFDGFDGLNTGGRYNPNTDTWAATSTTNAPDARTDHTAVSTGSEMIIWGGQDAHGLTFNTGGRYNPVADNWTPTSTTNVPDSRFSHTAVWTGNEMIVWGGLSFNAWNTGGKYDPTTNTWTATSTTNAPSARSDHVAIWTGSEMIVWGGFDTTGGRYSPITDSWLATSQTNARVTSKTAAGGVRSRGWRVDWH